MDDSTDWSRSQNLLSLLLQSCMKGTESLYTTIPYFMRTRLHSFINKTSWSQLNEECEENLPESQEKAMIYYQGLLKQMETYIENMRLQSYCVNSDNATFMRIAKNSVEKEFGNDAVKFVKEIDLCLSKERELILMHTVSEEDEVMYTDETDIPEKRLKYKDVIAQLEKDISDLKTTLNEPIIQDPSQFAAQEDQDDMQSCTETTLIALNDKLKNIMVKFDNVMGSLEQDVGAWQTAETQASVKTGLPIDLTYIREAFSDFGHVLNMMGDMLFEGNRLQKWCQISTIGSLSPGHIGTLNNLYKLVEERYFSCNLVVCGQPKELISIENKDRKTTKQKECGTKSEEKKETCYTSKKRQGLRTTILLLGAKSFPGLTIRQADIELLADKDLAEVEERKKNGRPRQAVDECAKINGKPIIKGNQDTEYSIEWPDLQVTEFTRLDTTAVYRQFFRFRYIVRLEVHQNEYTVKVMSLPFTFNTGANQQLEHTGSRLWYCTNVDMYHGDFICPNSLPVERVMDMLNKRVMHITKKQRALTEEDKSFLLSRLSVTSDNTVNMQSYIKEKMRPTSNSKEECPSFYTWFHGVMNVFTHTLAKPWEKGIIYGFCSEQYAKEILLDEKIHAGTILLRPSLSKMENMSSMDASTALIMEVKIRTLNADSNGGFEVLPVPLLISFIKDNGFHRAIKGIKKGKESIAQFLYGMDGTNVKLVDVLMEFGEGERKADVYDGYGLMVKKMETLHVERINPQLREEKENRPDSKKLKLSKRKWLPEDSHHATASPSTDNNVPMRMKVEDIPGTSSFTGTAAISNVKNDPAVHDQQHQRFTQLGGLSVDVSKLVATQTSASTSFEPEVIESNMSPGAASSGFGSINSPASTKGPDSPLAMTNLTNDKHLQTMTVLSVDRELRAVRHYEATTVPRTCLPKQGLQLSSFGNNQVSQQREINSTTPQSVVSTALGCGGNIPNHLDEAEEPSKVRKPQVGPRCIKKTSNTGLLETNPKKHQQYAGQGYQQQYAGQGHQHSCQGHQQQFTGHEHQQQFTSHGHQPQSAGQGHQPQSAGQGHQPQSAGQGHQQQCAGHGHQQQFTGHGHQPQSAGQGHQQQWEGQGHQSQYEGQAVRQWNLVDSQQVVSESVMPYEESSAVFDFLQEEVQSSNSQPEQELITQNEANPPNIMNLEKFFETNNMLQ